MESTEYDMPVPLVAHEVPVEVIMPKKGDKFANLDVFRGTMACLAKQANFTIRFGGHKHPKRGSPYYTAVCSREGEPKPRQGAEQVTPMYTCVVAPSLCLSLPPWFKLFFTLFSSPVSSFLHQSVCRLCLSLP